MNHAEETWRLIEEFGQAIVDAIPPEVYEFSARWALAIAIRDAIEQQSMP